LLVLDTVLSSVDMGLPPHHLAQQSPCHHPRRGKRVISEGTTAFKSTHRHLPS
jgi:hypothetical protein